MPYPFTSQAPESRSYTGVGISRDAKLYVYGSVPGEPGEVQPAVIGCPNHVEIREMAATSEYGKRSYLLLFLDSPTGDESGNLVLRVPIGYTKPNGDFQLSGPTRSLLAALLLRQPSWRAVKIFATRGTKANFLDVIPLDANLEPMEQVRTTLIPPNRESAVQAVCDINNALRSSATHA